MTKQTRKPCHGCGESPGPFFRAADSVCGSCKELMEDGRKYRTRLDAEADVVHKSLPHAPHSFPYIHNGYVDYKDNHPGVFQGAFYELAIRLSVPGECAKGRKRLVSMRDSAFDGGNTVVALPSDVANLLDTLYCSANDMVQAGYANGHKDGHRFVVGLADGSVSIDDFNKVTLGEDEEE